MKHAMMGIAIIIGSIFLHASDENFMFSEERTSPYLELELKKCSDPEKLKKVICLQQDEICRQRDEICKQHAFICELGNITLQVLDVNQKFMVQHTESQNVICTLQQELQQAQEQVQYLKQQSDPILRSKLRWCESKLKVMHQIVYMGMAIGCTYAAYNWYFADRS